ncbi:hypothetical protein [Hyphomicrobium sulfonivorans]|uniref:hypothetical protein n=1 Tax=Hyphomicrobium sulfonivorans TaxID=121290 RepID=UPI00156D5347|nr:hypothetical protein [Hyphomicrobium sulfonivorans]MBI1650346.1 hypothetical protein [Hyphomicrobium sulfonivorans]NSL72289.1 hypothetical protein [Hyphomicrobium sulfonivorans]
MTTTDRAVQRDEQSRANLTAAMGYGGWQATILSAFALALSAYSLYETSFKTAEIEVFIPPVIQYARDGGGDTELFSIPITVTNSGARTGTILSLQLTAENLKTNQKKQFYSAFLGEHQVNADAPNRSFAPLSIAGRETFSDTIRFYPDGDVFPKVIDDAGDVRFTLNLVTAQARRPDFIDKLFTNAVEPVVFERTLPWYSDQMLSMRRQAISMPERKRADGQSGAAATPASEPAPVVQDAVDGAAPSP